MTNVTGGGIGGSLGPYTLLGTQKTKVMLLPNGGNILTICAFV